MPVWHPSDSPTSVIDVGESASIWLTRRCEIPRNVCTVTAVGDPNPTPQQVGFAGGDPVQVVDTDIDGACHDYIERQVGNVTGGGGFSNVNY